jgi:hypothetical protein
MSGLETLPPDQRAVLQLILAQRRDYAELAGLLQIDPGAVRTRAHAGLDALAGGTGGPDAAQRARIADYLLGQQDEGERIVTLAELGESPDACRWAGALREQIAPLAARELPALPAIAANGAVPHATLAPPPEPPQSPAAPALSPPQPQPPEPAQPPTETAQPSRLGGAILLAIVAALAIALAVVLLTGGDDEPRGSAPQTTRSTPARQPATTGDVLAQVNLLATPAGGQAAGIGVVQRAAGQLALAIEAQRLPANGAEDIYAVWIEGRPGARLLGFVPRQVRANGTFTVSAALPRNARRYSAVLVTRESTSGGDVPPQPGEAIMRGVLRLS